MRRKAAQSAKRLPDVKRFITISGVLLILVSLPGMAQHRQEGGKRHGNAGPERPMPQRQALPGQPPAREAAYQHREMPRDGRMSPTEREQLRRDVHEHGREIYHERAGPGKR
jgi:hypothetical protein